MIDFFGNDEYWKKHINEKLEDDIWTDERETTRFGQGKNYIVFIAKKK